MDRIKDVELAVTHSEIEWSNCTETLNKVSDSSEASISVQDDVKIKVEIELKEEENGLIYQPDFYGRLRLVSLNQVHPDEGSAIKSEKTGNNNWCYVEHPLQTTEINDDNLVPTEQSRSFECVYGQMSNIYEIPKETNAEPAMTNFPSTVGEASEIYSYEDSLQQQFPGSSQDGDIYKKNRKKKELSYILAEKKRNYRNRIKEENPTMWCAMKQKEACKKREQREEKRFILLEMQKTMQLLSLPDSPDMENHRMYLEALKERYPEIWTQLVDALSSAEQRNNQILDGHDPKRRLSKPIRMYKDVVEAQKKYLYRQRIKLERPDLYEQQKARDSYARSIRRMLKKKLAESQNNVLSESQNNVNS